MGFKFKGPYPTELDTYPKSQTLSAVDWWKIQRPKFLHLDEERKPRYKSPNDLISQPSISSKP